VPRPFVCINMASTADGKITSAAREYPRITSPLDRREMDRLRAEADAILVGAETLRADDPPLHLRDEAMLARRRALGKPDGLMRVAVTASARLDATSAFFDETDRGEGRIVATVEEAPAERLAVLEGRAEIWKVGRVQVDLPALLDRLAGRGVARLLVEGGGTLNWALVRDDLVDELYLTLAPALLGGRDAPTLLEGDGFPMKRQRRLRLESVRQEGDELYCRYTFLR